MATLYQREGTKNWYARIEVGDEVRRISTGTRNKREAQQKADEAERQANRLLVSEVDLTLVVAAHRMLALPGLSRWTVQGYKQSLMNIVGMLGDFPLKVLDDEQISAYVKERSKSNHGHVQLRRDLAFLSSLYTKARHWEGGPKVNPLRGFDKRGIPEAAKRTRYATPEEFERLLKACTGDHQRLYLILSVGTGMRPGELLSLRWEQINLKENEIVLGNSEDARTKNGETRTLPLSTEVRNTLLSTDPDTRRGYVITTPGTDRPMRSFVNSWRGLQRRTGLTDLRIYDLRHTFATWATEAGMDMRVLQDLLGHKTPTMTARYAKVTRKARRFAMSVVDRDTGLDT